MIDGSLKSLLLLWENLARNHRYSKLVTERDIQSFKERAENEGLPFLTGTLPSLGRALDSFHALTTWETPCDFKLRSDGLPLFLGVAVEAALGGNSVAVDCIRQLAYVFYKLEVPYAEDAKQQFLRLFTENDREVGAFNLEDPNPSIGIAAGRRGFSKDSLIAAMRGLINRILLHVDPLDIRPSHTSGATACKTPNHDKYHKLRYYPKLDNCYDYGTYFFYSATHLADEYEKLTESSHADPFARICLVPKDSRGPRVISCEPAELMYIQQGIMRLLYRVLETNRLTKGRINFTDQSINRNFAHLGSLGKPYATMDLKDASDRVSLNLIRRVFPDDWVEALEACRSEETTLPNGERIKLNKFAPMGSSCCFPVEALVFWTCAEATKRLSGALLSNPEVYVYGDDIICDPELVPVLTEGLEAVGLQVNAAKTFCLGPFRESCGGDYHNGMEVTPLRVRKWINKFGTNLDSCAELINDYIDKFGEDAGRSFASIIEAEIGFVFPRSSLQFPLTLRLPPSASNDVFFRRRWSKDYQRYEHRILTSVSKASAKHPPNWGELLRKELSRDEPDRGFGPMYENRLNVLNSKQKPGEYVAIHTTRKMWNWTWLG